MAKTPDKRGTRRGGVRQPTMKAPPPPPAGKRSKTDAERLDDVLKKSAAKAPDERARKPDRNDD